VGRNKRIALAVLAAATALAVVTVGPAQAVRVVAGNLVLNFGGGFAPKKLPRTHDAPIKFWGWGSIATADGSQPPALKRLIIEYDKHGHVETRGLPRCTVRKLENTIVRQARRRCPGAIVGAGLGKATVKFPDQARIPISSPITIFNGPRIKRQPSVIAHAYTTVPAPTTFVVPIRIQRIRKGRYGYRVDAKIPAIAGGYGSPTFGRIKIGRTWNFRGRKLSYVNARCVGGRLQARGQALFRDGTSLRGSIFRPCQVRR